MVEMDEDSRREKEHRKMIPTARKAKLFCRRDLTAAIDAGALRQVKAPIFLVEG